MSKIMKNMSDLQQDLLTTGLTAIPDLPPLIEGGQPVVIVASCTDAKASALLQTGLTSASENERADRFRLDQSRREHLLGRSIIRKVMGGLLQLSPEAVPIAMDARGKPVVAGQECHFNVTHSNGWVAVGFCLDRRIGVDIEEASRIDAMKVANLSQMVLSPAERQAMSASPIEARVPLFLRLWRLKEAILKAEGCGLIDDLASLDVSHLTNNARGKVRFSKAIWLVSEKSLGSSPAVAIALELQGAT
eukprot:g2130.t1